MSTNPRRISNKEQGSRVGRIMTAAADAGWLSHKDSRISGRVNRELIEKAKAATGIASDTELVEFALANIAVEDPFDGAFEATWGTVSPDIDLGI